MKENKRVLPRKSSYPRLSFWANKKIELPTKVSFVRKKKVCRHRWRVGSWNGVIVNKMIRKKSLNIWCEKCRKKIRAYLKGEK